MLPVLDTYDWCEAFGYAGDTAASFGSWNVSPVPGSRTGNASFGRDDVVFLLGRAEGERDGPPWLCVGKLQDGRWFCLRAGCDNTGWDCHAEGHASVALSAAEILRLGMSREERQRCRCDVDVAALASADDEYILREVAVLALSGAR
jgi:hypothetical protein